jgi:sugar diacid utilization regulator
MAASANAVTRDPAVERLMARVSTRLEAVARAAVERYRQEIPDYAGLDDDVLYGDVMQVTVDNIRALMANLERGEPLTEAQLEEMRDGGARRVHQGVSIPGMLSAYRMWAQSVWDAIVACAENAEEREAALCLAGRILQHLDAVSTAAAQGYLEEALGASKDREMIRRDLLDALVSGQADSEAARLQAEALGIALAESYIVVVATTGTALDGTLAARAAMRRVAEAMRVVLQPRTGAVLIGMRADEVIAFSPADGHGALADVKQRCARLAAAAGADGICVGIGAWHPGASGVVMSFEEAREAAGIALELGATGEPVAFDDILIDHLLRSSSHSPRVLAEIIRPLREYDEQRRAELVPTLEAYFTSGFNLTKSAAALSVNPNTVVYRLKRVHELTGRDTHDPHDLLVLSLALRSMPATHAALRSPRAGTSPALASSKDR